MHQYGLDLPLNRPPKINHLYITNPTQPKELSERREPEDDDITTGLEDQNGEKKAVEQEAWKCENQNPSIDGQIFTETQIKRLLGLPYFFQNETEADKYQKDSIHEVLQKEEHYAIQNIGHSTVLIQVKSRTTTLNIITDPVFESPSKILYPAMTDSHPKTVAGLPPIHVILISHNHRDHVDWKSLKAIIKNHKGVQVYVPLGDGPLFAKLEKKGWCKVFEFNWYMKKTFAGVNFISIPSDHRSGRNVNLFKGGYVDHFKSLVLGWIINPEEGDVIFKYSGDTKPLQVNEQSAIDLILTTEIKEKNKKMKRIQDTLPNIVCIEPSGPTYTHSGMIFTHQSAAYSVLLKFIDAYNLARFFHKKIPDILKSLKTVMVHHNKFQLGPDRFNEARYVVNSLYEYVSMTDADRKKQLDIEKAKLSGNWDRRKLKEMFPFKSKLYTRFLPKQTSLLIHANDFIFADISLVEKTTGPILRAQDYIKTNTIFPKIGARLNSKSFDGWNYDPTHTKRSPNR